VTEFARVGVASLCFWVHFETNDIWVASRLLVFLTIVSVLELVSRPKNGGRLSVFLLVSCTLVVVLALGCAWHFYGEALWTMKRPFMPGVDDPERDAQFYAWIFLFFVCWAGLAAVPLVVATAKAILGLAGGLRQRISRYPSATPTAKQ